MCGPDSSVGIATELRAGRSGIDARVLGENPRKEQTVVRMGHGVGS